MNSNQLTSDQFVLLRDDKLGSAMLFADPIDVITIYHVDDVLPAIARLEFLQKSGKYLAGFISYEAGYVFEPKLKAQLAPIQKTPLLSIGVFDNVVTEGDTRLVAPSCVPDVDDFLTDAVPAWSFDEYQEKFNQLHEHLRKGDCYQANLTMPVNAKWHGDPLLAFWSLIQRQPVQYGAYVSLDGPKLISRSPELFFRVDKDRWIETHPMKGTMPRGNSALEDQDIIASMLSDEKTLAENRMIVDLLRNDISRISDVGSLSVPKLFNIETYPTVHQMVSQVRAKLSDGIGFSQILEALFPCGSVTGAPKMWAMNILHALEREERQAYCGAIGYVSPTGEMCFNVPIRTIALYENGQAKFNIGGGIVSDSTAQSEYAECLLKAKFALGERPLKKL